MNPLFPYQIENINFLKRRKKILLADDMGFGKTRSVLYSIVSLPALIICPKQVIPEWINEIQLQNQFTWTTTDWDGNYDLYLFNYEKLLNEAFFERINRIAFDTIVLDECHRIRNPETRTHQQVCRLHRTTYRYAVSGTPLVNNIYDVLSIFTFLNHNDMLWHVKRKTIFGVAVGPRYLLKSAHYKKLLKKYLIRHDTELVHELPELLIESQQIPYPQEEHTIPLGFGFFTTLRRNACNNPLKQEWVIEFITTHPGEAIVIFADFLAPLMDLYQVYPQASIITGTTKKYNPSSNLILCSTAGEHGINLQRFNLMINLSPPLTYASLTQRYKRIYRLGQEKPCQIINLISTKSVEEYIYQAILHNKKIIVNEYIGEYLQIAH